MDVQVRASVFAVCLVVGGHASADSIGGVDLGDLTDYLFVFTDGSDDANWQGATRGFAGDVSVNGQLASERTSGGVPYAGTIFSNDATLGDWQDIIDQNPGQASALLGEAARLSSLQSDLAGGFAQINGLTVTPGFTSISSASLDGLDTQNGIAETIVINVTDGFQISSQIGITGDAGDAFILRWDEDASFGNGYQGEVKFKSGGAIVPLGGLTARNFVHVAGDINASGGGSTPAAPFPQGPRLNNGLGPLIDGGSDFDGGGFFTGYWLTTGDPADGNTHSLSNAIFVGGWYTSSSKFSLTSGTSGVHLSPCLGDLDGNGQVTVADFLALLAAWGPCPTQCPADLDGDGSVGVTDFLILLENYKMCG